MQRNAVDVWRNAVDVWRNAVDVWRNAVDVWMKELTARKKSKQSFPAKEIACHDWLIDY